MAQALPGLKPQLQRHLVDMTVRASATASTLSSAHMDLDVAVSDRQALRILAGMNLDDVENLVNDALWNQSKGRLPRKPIVAVDMTLIPYHGKPHEREAELRRGKAQSGTTWFHAYASLNVVVDKKRYTLAVTFIEKHERMDIVVARLLDAVLSRGLRVHRLLADKGFCTKKCIQVLQDRGVAFVIPLALRGRAARALQRGRRSYNSTHTIAGITLPVAVDVVRNNGKYHGKKPGNQYFPYLYWGFEAEAKKVAKLYTKRGGIETTYRLMNQARARTTTRRVNIRFYLFAASMLLQNAWINATWQISQPTRGRQGRKKPRGYFGFKRFLRLLLDDVENRRHRNLSVHQLPGGE